MLTSPQRRLPTVLVLWTVAIVLAAPPRQRAAAAPAGRPLVLIVAASSPVTDLSRSDLKRLFSGSVVTASGIRLIPFNFPPGSAERKAFDAAVLDMSPVEAGRFWVDRKIRGQSGAPRALPSSVYVGKVVAKLPGAISYIALDQLPPGVRPVRIGGIAHTDRGYPLVLR